MKTCFRYFLIVGALLVISTEAFAQAAVPGSAESGRVQERIEGFEKERKTEPVVTVPKSQDRAAPAGADKIMFELSAIQVDGMTAYTPEEILPLYQDMLGKKISLADVYEIARKLTAKYRNDGYILTQIIVPPQKINSGIVHLEAIEGFIDGYEIQGDARSGMEQLHRYARKIVDKKPLNIKTMERYLLLANDLPGLTVRSILSPSSRTKGASSMQLVVTEDDLYEGFLTADNRGSRFLGQGQLNFANRLNAPLKQNETITLQYVTAPDNHPDRELDFWAAGIERPVNSEGTILSLNGSVSRTRPGYTLAPFNVDGRTEAVSLRAEHPLIRSRRKNFDIGTQFDLIDVKRTDNISVAHTQDRLRVLRADGEFEFADKFVGVNAIRAEVSRGLGFLGSSEKSDPFLTRARGNAEFTKVTGEITRLQRISQDWELFAGVSGQKSANNLLANEEFGIGGVEYGRAYDSSEITGEDGWAGKVELRWTEPRAFDLLDTYQIFTYYDYGRVWDPDNTVAANRIRSLASVGGGVRVNINEHIAGAVEIAFPLTREVQAAGTDGDEARGFFSLSSRF